LHTLQGEAAQLKAEVARLHALLQQQAESHTDSLGMPPSLRCDRHTLNFQSLPGWGLSLFLFLFLFFFPVQSVLH
jgi:hypothetical protein